MIVESQAIRDSARGQTCAVRQIGTCNWRTDTTVTAHVPGTTQKGMGMKVPDLFVCHACSDCHDAIDGRNNRPRVPAADLLRAMAETQLRLVGMGLIKVAK